MMKAVTAFFAMAILAFLSLTASAENKYTHQLDRFTVVDALSGDRFACAGVTVVIRHGVDDPDIPFDDVGSGRGNWGCKFTPGTSKPDDPGTDPDTGEPVDPAPPRPCNPTGTNPGPAPCP